jgi:hypothetical protein
MGEWTYRSMFSSALVGGEWSTSRPSNFTPEERAPGTHCIGDWVGPRSGVEDVEKRKFLLVMGLELRPFRCAGRASRYTD